METRDADTLTAKAIAELRRVGALFAYLHGSRAAGTARPDSDIDIAAFFDDTDRQAYDILLPRGIDLLVLDHAPLEVAGRIAVSGRLLFEDAPERRIFWEATTRKIYADELPRIRRSHAEFLEAVRGG